MRASEVAASQNLSVDRNPASSRWDGGSGAFDVGGDRGDELLDRVELHLVAQALPELHRERVTAELVVGEVQQERLDMQRLRSERRVRSDIDRSEVAPAVLQLRDARVDPLSWKEEPGPGSK